MDKAREIAIAAVDECGPYRSVWPMDTKLTIEVDPPLYTEDVKTYNIGGFTKEEAIEILYQAIVKKK